MPQRALVNAEQVTPAWLTAVLHSQGSLPRGRVIAVTAGPGQATFGSLPTWDERMQDCHDTADSTVAFMAALGDALPSAWRAVYERVLPALPGLFQRHRTGRNLTLAHGDAHLGNFLFPKDAQTGDVYLADWQFWHPTIGGADLAFMLAAEWETDIHALGAQP